MMFDQLRLIVAVLVFLSSILSWTFADAQDQAQSSQAEPDAALANPLAAYRLDRLSATRERPLFSSSRRPPKPAVVVRRTEPAPPPSPPNVTLFGVIIGADGARAVLRVGGAGKIVQVRLGEEVGGWKVTQLEERRLVLSLIDRSVAFSLFSSDTAGTVSIDSAAPILNGGPQGEGPSDSASRVTSRQ